MMESTIIRWGQRFVAVHDKKEIYTSDLKKEIVAFAYTNGGTIYIGVLDKDLISKVGSGRQTRYVVKLQLQLRR